MCECLNRCMHENQLTFTTCSDLLDGIYDWLHISLNDIYLTADSGSCSSLNYDSIVYEFKHLFDSVIKINHSILLIDPSYGNLTIPKAYKILYTFVISIEKNVTVPLNVKKTTNPLLNKLLSMVSTTFLYSILLNNLKEGGNIVSMSFSDILAASVDGMSHHYVALVLYHKCTQLISSNCNYLNKIYHHIQTIFNLPITSSSTVHLSIDKPSSSSSSSHKRGRSGGPVSLEKLLLPSDSDDSGSGIGSGSDVSDEEEASTLAVTGNSSSSGRKGKRKKRKAPTTIFNSQTESIHRIDYIDDSYNNITGIISESERDLMQLFSDLKNENLVIEKVNF